MGRIVRLTASTALALALLILAAASAPAGSTATAKGRQACGTFPSESIYPRAKVIAIRGVKCDEARRVAKKFDHKGFSIDPWACAYAHGGKRRLFSCGYGGSGGDLRDYPHALIAKGVGSP